MGGLIRTSEVVALISCSLAQNHIFPGDLLSVVLCCPVMVWGTSWQ